MDFIFGIVVFAVHSYVSVVLYMYEAVNYMCDNFLWVEKSKWHWFDYFNDTYEYEYTLFDRYAIFKETDKYHVQGYCLGRMDKNAMGDFFNDYDTWPPYCLWEYKIFDRETGHEWTGLALFPIVGYPWELWFDMNFYWPRILYINPRDSHGEQGALLLKDWLSSNNNSLNNAVIKPMSNYDLTYRFFQEKIVNIPDYLSTL